MTIQQLIALITVAEAGSIRAASERLFQTTAAVTKTLKNLETEIGVPLIERLPRGVRLTKDGETLLVHARRALREIDAAETKIRRRLGDAPSKLSCAVTPVVMMHSIGQTLDWFRSRYPNVNLIIRDGTLSHAMPFLRNNIVDFAVVVSLPRRHSVNDLAIEKIGEIEICFAVRKGHPLLDDYEKASDVKYLQQCPWVITADNIESVRRRFEVLLRFQAPQNITLCTPQTATAIVQRSNSITVLPKALLQAPVCANLTQLPSAIEVGHQQLEMITLAGRPKTPALEYLMYCMRKHCLQLCDVRD
ncbi:MAG: LysR family transcriptional regulator [Candidatus Aphodousia sp.]|nr:LysR family transcriptional regulator [Sutterella sp.]MDY2900249.1 LysR family transcriptional regulator [Candidatus Aphodousia sp.]